MKTSFATRGRALKTAISAILASVFMFSLSIGASAATDNTEPLTGDYSSLGNTAVVDSGLDWWQYALLVIAIGAIIAIFLFLLQFLFGKDARTRKVRRDGIDDDAIDEIDDKKSGLYFDKKSGKLREREDHGFRIERKSNGDVLLKRDNNQRSSRAADDDYDDRPTQNDSSTRTIIIRRNNG
ncbi:MAG: hypothetical protein LBM12_02180 [Candidatus Nomurabacteria bacterium]|jgi:preprotein translocase subunit SecE|nr:hypothetical protein [Candidatus Nomurabacteria bacterium]